MRRQAAQSGRFSDRLGEPETAPLPPLRAGVGPLRFSRARLGAERTLAHRLFGRFGWGRCGGVRRGRGRLDAGRPGRRRRQQGGVGLSSQPPIQRPQDAARPAARPGAGPASRGLSADSRAGWHSPSPPPPAIAPPRGTAAASRAGAAGAGGELARELARGWSGRAASRRRQRPRLGPLRQSHEPPDGVVQPGLQQAQLRHRRRVGAHPHPGRPGQVADDGGEPPGGAGYVFGAGGFGHRGPHCRTKRRACQGHFT